jgi:hypothetical protein
VMRSWPDGVLMRIRSKRFGCSVRGWAELTAPASYRIIRGKT